MRESERGETDSVGRLTQALFLLTAAVLSDALLSVPIPLSNLIGGFCLIAFAVVVRSSVPVKRAGRAGRTLTAAIVLGVAVASALLLVTQGSMRMIVLLLFLCWLDLNERRSGSTRPWYTVAELTAVLFASYLLAVEHVSWAAWGVSRAAVAFSWVAGLTTAGEVSVGAGYLGIDLLVLFGLYVIVAARLSQDSRIAIRTAALLGMLLAAGIVHAALWVHLPQIDVLYSDGLLQPFVNAYDFRTLLFLVLLGLLSVQPLRFSLRVEKTPFGGRWTVVAAVLVAICWILLLWGGPIGDGDGRVLVLDSLRGANGEDVPVFDSYGLENAGMFGLLPGYLSGRGYDVRVVEALGDDDLGWADVLVIINLRDTLDVETARSVWDFVDSGGSLLLAGDHTGAEQIRDPSNALLEPYNITLAFDSAIPMRDGWLNCLSPSVHPVLDRISESEIQVLVGASLSVKPPARVVLNGRDGYSDAGDPTNEAEGDLGNMSLDAGERVGDLALVAEASSGAGRVMVFGDTTPFQNPALPRDYRFVDRVFRWLESDVNAGLWGTIQLIAALVLICGAVLIVYLMPGDVRFLLTCAGAISIVFVIAALPWWSSAVDDADYATPYAVVDLSHFEIGQMQKSPDAVDGLSLNLQRNGYTCFLMRDFDESLIRGSQVLVLPSPLVPFKSGEITVIDDFVSSGGLLVVTAGSERPAGARTLLAHFGLRLGTVPMGQASASWNQNPMHFWSAWPMEVVSARQAQVVAEVWGHPAAVYVPRGAGGVFAVGDASFLLNRNLEDIRTYNLHNIIFLREFLNEMAQGRGGDA